MSTIDMKAAIKILLPYAYLSLIIIGLVCVTLQPAYAAAAPTASQTSQIESVDLSQKHILLLYSGTLGFPAYRKHCEEFINAAQESVFSQNNLHVEYLELTRNNKPDYTQHLCDYITNKYLGLKIDLVVTIDGGAQDFMITKGKYLFPGIPLITVLSPKNLTQPVPDCQIVQIPAHVEISGTVDIMRTMFPDTKHILVIIGGSSFETQWLDKAHKSFDPLKDSLTIEYTNQNTFKDILQKASSLPQKSVILYLALYQDITGQSFVPVAVLELLTKVANAPVFGIYDGILGKGIVGGSLMSYGAEGKRSAQIA